jgi:hypothetical protein
MGHILNDWLLALPTKDMLTSFQQLNLQQDLWIKTVNLTRQRLVFIRISKYPGVI